MIKSVKDGQMFGLDTQIMGADIESKRSNQRRVSRRSSRASSKGVTSCATPRSHLAVKVKQEVLKRKNGKFEVLVIKPAKRQI